MACGFVSISLDSLSVLRSTLFIYMPFPSLSPLPINLWYPSHDEQGTPLYFAQAIVIQINMHTEFT